MTTAGPARRARGRLLLCALAAAGPATAASNCDALRDQIDAGIRAKGVQAFTLAIVDAPSRASGRVVGTCDKGSRKILYAPVAATGDRAAAPRPRDEPLLTECKDGRVSMGGDCRR